MDAYTGCSTFLTEFSTIPGLCVRMVLIVSNTSAICSASKRSWHSISAQNVPVRPTPSLQHVDSMTTYAIPVDKLHTCSEL